MTMSNKVLGGCGAVKIDCTGTNTDAVLHLYKTHDNNVTHPPDGNLQTVEYAQCCVAHQCKAGPDCGVAPWVSGLSISSFEGKSSPCAGAGCDRLQRKVDPMGTHSGSALPIIATCLAVVASVSGLAFVRHRGLGITTSRGAAHSHVLLRTSVEDAQEVIDQEAVAADTALE